MKYLSKIYYLTVWAVLFVPALVKAWSPGDPVVPCGTSINTDACEFSHIIKLIDNILDIFIWLAVPVATVLFAWIGWIFIYSGDKSGARNDAKKKLILLMKGMFFILASWLIIKLITSGLGVKSDYNQFINTN